MKMQTIDRAAVTPGSIPDYWPRVYPERPLLSATVRLPERLRHLAGRPDIYALCIAGNCMTPDYADGDHVICDPHEAVAPGHAVALWRRDRTVWLKWLARIDADAFEVQQMNPLKAFRLRRVDFPYCHAVVGSVRPDDVVAYEAAS